jgi:hypothetical protein
MSELYALAYISKNTIKGDAEQINQEITQIIATSNKNNSAHDVTGALLYSGGYFCQVIEGSQDALEELYETIQMDDRHGQVTILHYEPIAARNFSEWAMALAGIEDNKRFDIEGVLASKDELKIKNTGKDLVNVLDQMIKQHQSVLKSTS